MKVEFAMDMEKHARWLGDYYPVIDGYRDENRFLTKLSWTFRPSDPYAEDVTIVNSGSDEEYQETRLTWQAFSLVPPAALALSPHLISWYRRRKRS